MNDQSTTELVTTESSPLEAIERATIDVQISTAKRYPRVLSTVKKDIMSMATMDLDTAESCFYKLPRGGKNIEGGSIRLAEIALSCYGNVRAGTRVIATTLGENPHVVIQAVCHDLEKNNMVTIEKRRRITKKKSKDAPDDDDINLAVNAGSAIALRDAIYKIIPKILINPALEAAKRVAIGDASTLEDRRGKALESLAKMGVQAERVFAVLEKKAIEDIDLEDLETLTGLRNAVRDGQTTLDQAFPAPTKEPKAGLFGANAPQSPPDPAAAQKNPTPLTEPAKPAEKPAAPTTPPTTNALVNDKTKLAEWLLQNSLGWGQIQTAVSQEFGNWADSIDELADLSMQQAKAIYNGREDILKLVQQ